MSETLFPTQEIGSIAKPNWRVKKVKGVKISESDLRELNKWAETLRIENTEEIVWLLKQRPSNQVKQKVKEWAAVFAVKLFEASGLDIIYNGEQWRSEMYQEAVNYINGFEFCGHVRSFDNKYYLKAACVEEPSLVKPYHLQEFLFTKKHTKKPLKVPITGAYTLADWSFNEFYARKWRQRISDVRKANYESKRELSIELAKRVIRPNIKALVEAGADFIQVDEPAATTHPSEMNIFFESFEESTKGINCKFSLHICFSNYSLLFPKILELKRCRQLTLEFANRDDDNRTGYSDLKLFKEHSFDKELGLGVLNVHSDVVETPGLVRDRILYAARFIDAGKISVNPDCGLRTRSWNVTYGKLCNMVRGAELAREEFD